VEHVVEAGRPDVVINATSVGLNKEDGIAGLPLDEATSSECRLLLDLVYGDHQTAVSSFGAEFGITVVDGLEVLVRQGARSVEIWTGQAPSLQALRDAVS
jgi:shikimate dehydrogenase